MAQRCLSSQRCQRGSGFWQDHVGYQGGVTIGSVGWDWCEHPLCSPAADAQNERPAAAGNGEGRAVATAYAMMARRSWHGIHVSKHPSHWCLIGRSHLWAVGEVATNLCRKCSSSMQVTVKNAPNATHSTGTPTDGNRRHVALDNNLKPLRPAGLRSVPPPWPAQAVRCGGPKHTLLRVSRRRENRVLPQKRDSALAAVYSSS